MDKTTEKTPKKNNAENTPDRKKTLLISLAILITGAVVTLLIFLTEPVAEPEAAVSETAMLVEVTGVEQGNFIPSITATGRVIPEQEIILSPRVSGEIIEIAGNFTPGSFVSKGEKLLQIDPSDYRNTLQLRESELMQAKADLDMEMGRQYVAQKDYELFEEEIPEENQALILREPQLQAVKSRIEAASASVEQARLDLQRTTITAPFNAHILNRNSNVGSQVAPGINLGRLVGVDLYWVEVSVPPSRLQWLDFPDKNNSRGSEVRIRNRTAWSKNQHRKGYLHQLIGTLEEQTRLARVLVAVPDPLARNLENEPALMIGSFVEVSIQAKELKDVIRLDRSLIRQDQTVWLMEDEKLNIREVDILMQDETYAYITGGMTPEDQVVITNLATVVEGARLRVEERDNHMDETDDGSGSLEPVENRNTGEKH